MTTAEPPIVTSVWIDATPDRVFPYFTDPARLTQWLGHTAELDPTPGGRFAVDINQRPVRGSYLEIEPPHRVVFSWGDAGSAQLPPGTSRVEVELVATGAGTTVTLRHHGLSGEVRADHARGWPVVLGRLVAAA
ncbi:MAG: hypothetical protein JWO02_1823 [Solirubrobacterales bacterium]|nr:hypothetical protein [Solirubrobacterales bacterium]